jgi:hypothetical protein
MVNNRRGTLSVAALAALVSARDLAIFWQHATIDAGTRACVRVLGRLLQHRLIYRLERQIGGQRAGSAAYVWRLDDAGDRLLRAQPGREASKRIRELSPSPMFLSHTLAIAEVRARLHEAAQGQSFELVSVGTEPFNWRSFEGVGSTDILKPDLHVILGFKSFEDHWFIELDLGTESIPTLIRKCLTYQAHWASGREQARTGVYPRVAWLIEDALRRERLLEAIAKEARLTSELFVSHAIDQFINVCGTAADVQPEGGTT